MKIKFFTEAKMLIEYLNARGNGYNGSYSEFVELFIKNMVGSKNDIKETEDIDKSNVYSLISLSKDLGVYVKDFEDIYLERPEGMSQEDVLKVIAHNREYFEKYYSSSDMNITFLTQKALVDMFDFKTLSKDEIGERSVVPLYFVKGYDMYFIHSQWFKNHTLWFERYRDITEEEVIEIYDSLNSNVAKKLKSGE